MEEMKRIVRSNVRDVRLRERLDGGVKRVIGMYVGQGNIIVHDRSEWRAVVNA